MISLNTAKKVSTKITIVVAMEKVVDAIILAEINENIPCNATMINEKFKLL
jgi:hypothetical protein